MMMNDWIKDEDDLGAIRFWATNCAELIHSINTELNTNHVSRWYLLDKLGNLVYNVKMLKNWCEGEKDERAGVPKED